MSDTGAAVPKVLNPLWIISLFLGLAEVTTGVAATQVAGSMQILLVTFSTLFPIAVAAAFFAVLWARPYVLYAPKDFPRHLSAKSFVQAMQSASVAKQVATERLIGAAVEAALEKFAQDGIAATDPSPSDVRVAVAAVRSEFEKNLVSVNLEQFACTTTAVSLPVSGEMKIVEFLDAVWMYIADCVEPFTYGLAWLLQDSTTGKVFFEKHLANQPDQVAAYWRDKRTLHDVGILGGVELVALNLQG